MNRSTLAISLLRGCARLPLPCLHALGVALGWLAWLIPNPLRRIVAINLHRCLPELAPCTRRWLLRRNLTETGKGLLELGPLWLWPSHKVLAKVRSVEGQAEWQAALAEGRGAIAITPHLGAWEVAGLYLSTLVPLTTLYRPSRLGEGVDHLIRTARARLGAQLVATDQRGVRRLVQTLRQGHVLGILPDQDPGDEGGMYVPFFGQPANTMVLLSRLASRNRTPVVLLYAERLAWGRGYRLHFERLTAAIAEAPLIESVTALNQAVEQAIRRRPEQYLWSYKRFKRQPLGHAKVY